MTTCAALPGTTAMLDAGLPDDVEVDELAEYAELLEEMGL